MDPFLNLEVDYVKIAEETGAVIEEMKYGIEQVIKEMNGVLSAENLKNDIVIGIEWSLEKTKEHLSKYLDPEETVKEKTEELKPIIISSKPVCGSWSDIINGEVVTSLNITPDGISAVVEDGTTYKLSPNQFGELKFINEKACSECGRFFEAE